MRVTWQSLLGDERLAQVPFLVLGNKVDLPGAVSEGELRAALGLMETTGKDVKAPTGVRPIEVFMCSILRQTGYADGLQWLTNFIK